MNEKEEQRPSKAAVLARELQAEKRRLEEELSDLHAEYDSVKPTTPTGTLDWAVKWLAVVLGVVGVFLMTAGLTIPGQIAYLMSAIAWIFVGMNWSDRAIMIGSSITGTAVALELLQHFMTL